MDFRVLGPLEVMVDRTPLPLGGLKQRSVLALLLLREGRVVSVSDLVDGVWGDAPPRSASASLETYVSRLRRLLAPAGDSQLLVTQSPGYRLDVGEDELDLTRFRAALARAEAQVRDGALEAARDEYLRADGLFRGAPLEDLAAAPFAAIEIEHLRELRLDAVERRLDLDLELSRHRQVLPELEALAAAHPLREELWERIMLALYRSGRQSDALLVYDRLRRQLADDLGIDPGESLRQLHRRILQQEESLDPPGRSTPPVVADRAALAGRPATHWWSAGRRRSLAALAALAAAAVIGVGAVTLVEWRADRDEPAAAAADAPNTGARIALIDASSGTEQAAVPLSSVPVAAYPVYAAGTFWVNNFSPNSYVQIDPTDGRILRRVTPPPWPVDVPDSATLTPFAVDGDNLWVGSGHDLVRLDVRLDKVIDRYPLDDYVGGGRGLAEGVVVGGGSVWVSRDVGGGQIVRLDLTTGRVQQRFDHVVAHLQLAFGDGALWAADEDGVLRIDARDNDVVVSPGVTGTTWVAAGESYGWTSDPREGVVHKVSRTGEVVESYRTGLGAGFMGFTEGRLWVSNRDEGTVVGIDAVTGARATFPFDRATETLAAGGGTLLVSVTGGETLQGFVDDLPGPSLTLFSDEGQLGQGDEPALDTHPGAIQVANATCANLLRRDADGALRPEVAAGMPDVSADGRRYRFQIRPGYRFSPPSNEPLTAETFRFSIERALSPKLANNPTGTRPPGPAFVRDLVGERAFRRGDARHIRGLAAHGDTLSISLVRPSADFLERIALPFFCPVPLDTPVVAGALPRKAGQQADGTLPSAGPYYVSRYNNGEYVVLSRNPSYDGPRTAKLETIAIVEGIGATVALDWSDRRGWDGITTMNDPALAPGGPVERRWGDDGGATASSPAYHLTRLPATRLLAFDVRHGVFSHAWARRAASLVLDRVDLASAWQVSPTSQLLPSPEGSDLNPPSRPSLDAALRIAGGRTGHAVLAVAEGCRSCRLAAEVVRRDLARIGIVVEVREGGASHADIVDVAVTLPYPDGPRFLQSMLSAIPPSWVPRAEHIAVRNLVRLIGIRREQDARHMALAWERRGSVVAYGQPVLPQVIGKDVGCRAFTSWSYGLDLGALCATG